MNVIEDLRWRGLVHQTTDDEFLPGWLDSGCRTLYAGFDPTADSLHVGSLMPLMLLRRMQKAGHRPLALVGGATGMIGDPSGKSKERNLLSVEALETNIAGIDLQLRQFLDFDCGPQSAKLVNNFDWMSNFGYLEFLRDIGKNCSVNVMLAKDSVKGRLEGSESGLSYTEFSYMLLQAYDFVHLNTEFDCQLQVGGSDQWGNITAGIDLARRMRSVQLYGLTCPLLTKSDGGKMGKTETGTVWLSAQRTSPYNFYQYWRNVSDDDVSVCLRFLTEMSHAEIEQLDASRAENPGRRESQVALADALTQLVHGADGLAAAQKATSVLHGTEIEDMNDAQLSDIFADVPSQQLERSVLSGEGLGLIDALVAVGLAKSKSEARRTITEGGAYVNNRRRAEIETRLNESDLASETVMVLRRGRKKFALLRFA